MSTPNPRALLRKKTGQGGAGADMVVQFNPSSLRVTYTNQFGEDPPATHARATTAKLDVELIFDTTDTGETVYRYLNQLEALTRSSLLAGSTQANGQVPVIEFVWPIPIFEGVIESLTQTIEYWSHDGVPLRATVQLSMKETADIGVNFTALASRTSADIAINDREDNTAIIPAPSSPTGTTAIATQAGNSRAGRAVAAQNGLESMRGGASAGAFATVGASASAGLGGSAGAGASASAGIGVSASAKVGAAASFQATGGISASAGAGASLGFGVGAGVGASASAGIGAAAGIGMAAGASLGAGAGAAIGGGIGVGAGVSAGLSLGAGAGVSMGVSAGVSGSATTGVSASAGAFAGLGSSKMMVGNTGMDVSRLLPSSSPTPLGSNAQFDATGKLTTSGSTIVATSYTTQTTSFDGSTYRTSGGNVRVL